MNDLHRLDIGALARAYAEGDATPPDVTAAYLARIDRFDPALHAFVEIDRAGAERAAADGASRRGYLRPLEGIPVAIKANLAVAGAGWNAGTEIHRDRIATRDAAAVARLRGAGAVILGTLNMDEAALGAATDNPWFGRAANPHDQRRTPGGSSGGSGAAVAAGLCVAALGTDTLGSIRIPAAYTGVYGLKPTAGAVPDDGLAPLCRAFDAIGPLARSIDDLSAVWMVLGDSAVPAGRISRIVVLDDLGGVGCEPAVMEGYSAALDALPGARTTLHLPPLGAVRTAAFVAAARELGEHLAPHRTSDRLSPGLRWLLDFADAAAPDPGLLADVRRAVVDAVGDDAVLILPTTPQATFVHGGRAPVNQADFTCLANIAGLPALSLPSGRDRNSMPVAVQLIGSPGGEASLLALARDLDTALAAYFSPPCL